MQSGFLGNLPILESDWLAILFLSSLLYPFERCQVASKRC
jgi:hypothetical protein